MFKPVTGSALNAFDEETRNLFAKRQSDPRLTHALLTLPRAHRNHLPVIANENNPTVKEFSDYANKFPYMLIGGAAFYIFAANQFSKIYFPYGIVLRRSIPQTWQQYASHRLPIAVVFLTAWYMQREYPRKQRLDLTCDSEQ